MSGKKFRGVLFVHAFLQFIIKNKLQLKYKMKIQTVVESLCLHVSTRVKPIIAAVDCQLPARCCLVLVDLCR